MAEWPRLLLPNGFTTGPHPYGVKENVEVIPADLGRELYEAARAYREYMNEEWRRPGLYDPPEKKFMSALARYEREVGK